MLIESEYRGYRIEVGAVPRHVRRRLASDAAHRPAAVGLGGDESNQPTPYASVTGDSARDAAGRQYTERSTIDPR